MASKINLFCAAIIIVVAYSHCISKADATYCSLDKMKELAAEACEHLFLSDEPSMVRRKREYHHKSKYNDFEDHNKNHLLAVRRKTFPRGGYLKVTQPHFEHLSQLNISPMYKYHFNKKHHDINKKYHDGDRHKRDASRGIGLPYCCFNKCKEDFFCR